MNIISIYRSITIVKSMSINNFRLITLKILIVAVMMIISSPVLAQTKNSMSDKEKQVREFVAAFNSRNLEAMLELAAEDIQLFSLNKTKIITDADSKKTLRESMECYFRSCASCKSSLEWVKSKGERVVAYEIATWKDKNGELKNLKGLSVYEFKNMKISGVYYFPSEINTSVKEK